MPITSNKKVVIVGVSSSSELGMILRENGRRVETTTLRAFSYGQEGLQSLVKQILEVGPDAVIIASRFGHWGYDGQEVADLLLISGFTGRLVSFGDTINGCEYNFDYRHFGNNEAESGLIAAVFQ